MIKAKNVDEYIAGFPEAIQKLLQQIRETIKAAAPEAEEVISYGMPTFKCNGILVYFAGYAHHIGFYPTASGIEAFKEEIAPYEWEKGLIQFPLDKPMPLKLISNIVKFKVKENA